MQRCRQGSYLRESRQCQRSTSLNILPIVSAVNGTEATLLVPNFIIRSDASRNEDESTTDNDDDVAAADDDDDSSDDDDDNSPYK